MTFVTRTAAIDAPVYAEGKEINCLLTFAGKWTRARIDASDPFHFATQIEIDLWRKRKKERKREKKKKLGAANRRWERVARR